MNIVSVIESHLVFLTLFLCIFFFHFQHPALLCGIFCIVQLWAPTCTHKLEGHTLILTFSKKRKIRNNNLFTSISMRPIPMTSYLRTMGTGSVRPMMLGGEAERDGTKVRLLLRYKRKLRSGQPA